MNYSIRRLEVNISFAFFKKANIMYLICVYGCSHKTMYMITQEKTDYIKIKNLYHD